MDQYFDCSECGSISVAPMKDWTKNLCFKDEWLTNEIRKAKWAKNQLAWWEYVLLSLIRNEKCRTWPWTQRITRRIIRAEYVTI